MSTFKLSDSQRTQWEQDGYVMVPNLFSADEAGLLLKIAKAGRDMDNATVMPDASGAKSMLRLRYELHDDLYSTIVRCQRVAGTMAELLGDEVYHWHHKMMLKEPRVGGAWEWHQDYGYWYNDGCLFPDMASCMIALDRATRENGCLQIIKGSHKMGRIEHGVTGQQTGADMERVEQALKRMELIDCEMEPGAGLFFHSNLLHRSDQNRSEHPRWSLICCYNTAHNDLYTRRGNDGYHKLDLRDDAEVLCVGRRDWELANHAAPTT